MAKEEREKIGPFIVTSWENLNPSGITCAMCKKMLSHYDAVTDKHTPSGEELLKSSAVPVPNFGWFCSQECGKAYEEKYGIAFQRNSEGKISYY
jgi:hypothetical protein